jgi:c-di-GMP-binding flagellar brake protein YcgR
MIHSLTGAAKELAPTLIWTKDQEHVIRAHLKLLNQADQVICMRTPKDFELAKLKAVFQKNGSDECFVCITLGGAHIFFKTRFKIQDNVGLKFFLPTTAYEVQRRANPRYEIPQGYVFWAEFLNPTNLKESIKRKIYDISAGGLALVLPEQEASPYVTGVILQQLKISVRGKLIAGEGEVRYSKALSETWNGKFKKVGIRFKEFLPQDIELIREYVADETQKSFLRFL